MSCDLFSPSRATGIWRNPSPRHICFCVVRRDRDGDAVISGLDFSSTSTQLISLPLFFFICLSRYLSLSWRKGTTEGAKMSWLRIRERDGRREGVQGGRERERGREVVYLALLVTLLWLLSSSHALDFLKLLHHRPPCQSWLLIGWEELSWLHELHRGAPLAHSASKQLEFSVWLVKKQCPLLQRFSMDTQVPCLIYITWAGNIFTRISPPVFVLWSDCHKFCCLADADVRIRTCSAVGHFLIRFP